MSRHSECDTRRRILVTSEQLYMHRGFIGMGLSELLKTTEVLRGPSYHYFRSKEAFDVALLEHHYIGYLQHLIDHFDYGDGNCRDRLPAHYQHALSQFCQQEITSGCPTIELSTEVCDLSGGMRIAMDHDASQTVALLDSVLEKERQEGSLVFDDEAMTLLQVLYSLWLGASPQAKITCSARPLESALTHARQIIAAPAV